MYYNDGNRINGVPALWRGDMCKSLILLAAMLTGLGIIGCEDQSGGVQPQKRTMYALKDDVAFRVWPAKAVKTLRYGEEVSVDECDSSRCYLGTGSSRSTALLSELSDGKPPMGQRYVWGHFGDLKLNQQVTIRAYNPATKSLQVDGGTWVAESSLKERPETPSETKMREKAEAIAKVEQAKQRKEEQRQEREHLVRAAREAENDRRAFAQELRDKYLSMGADIKVSVSGSHAQRLVLEYPLINDVWLYQFQHNSDVMDALRAKGFTQLDLSDGWNYAKRLTFR